MTLTASNSKAALTGVGASVLGCLLAPVADRRDVVGSICLLLLVAFIALPAYFFVFGIKRQDMVGDWMLETSLVKRIASWLASAAATAFVLMLMQRLF